MKEKFTTQIERIKANHSGWSGVNCELYRKKTTKAQYTLTVFGISKNVYAEGIRVWNNLDEEVLQTNPFLMALWLASSFFLRALIFFQLFCFLNNLIVEPGKLLSNLYPGYISSVMIWR